MSSHIERGRCYYFIEMYIYMKISNSAWITFELYYILVNWEFLKTKKTK